MQGSLFESEQDLRPKCCETLVIAVRCASAHPQDRVCASRSVRGQTTPTFVRRSLPSNPSLQERVNSVKGGLRNFLNLVLLTNSLPHHYRLNYSIGVIFISLKKTAFTSAINSRKLFPFSLGNKHNVSSGLLGKYNPFSHFIIHVIR